ncbi:hypothetical protein HXX76_016007 [Chlamydomonas incerta]|uniref:RWP-RK domain-containing protein n=1 Tax=Chlamydomonas incerta TaxID=51695 RepID=A0A835S825_CHLIN|nr:hypothetical protein HXX76_016007 [Chlamydomonas incerta]|eukprot:KAG2422483.1 hypothetical protein HXX76_016007 [Chlamydomonas incerta]
MPAPLLAPVLPPPAREAGAREAGREGSHTTVLALCGNGSPAQPCKQPAEPRAAPVCGKRKQRNTPLARALRLVQAGGPAWQAQAGRARFVEKSNGPGPGQAQRPAPATAFSAKVRVLSSPPQQQTGGEIAGRAAGQDARAAPSDQECGEAAAAAARLAAINAAAALPADSPYVPAVWEACAEQATGGGASQAREQEGHTPVQAHGPPRLEQQQEKRRRRRRGLCVAESEAAACARQAAVAAARLAASEAAAGLPPDNPYALEACHGVGSGRSDEQDGDIWAQQRAQVLQQAARLQRALWATLRGSVSAGDGAARGRGSAAASREHSVGLPSGQGKAVGMAGSAMLSGSSLGLAASAADGAGVSATVPAAPLAAPAAGPDAQADVPAAAGGRHTSPQALAATAPGTAAAVYGNGSMDEDGCRPSTSSSTSGSSDQAYTSSGSGATTGGSDESAAGGASSGGDASGAGSQGGSGVIRSRGDMGAELGAAARAEPRAAAADSIRGPALGPGRLRHSPERSPHWDGLDAAAAGDAEAGGAAAGLVRQSQSWTQQLRAEDLPRWSDEELSDGSSINDIDSSGREDGDEAWGEETGQEELPQPEDEPSASDVTDPMLAAVLSQAAPERRAGAQGAAAGVADSGSDGPDHPGAPAHEELVAREAAPAAGVGPSGSEAEPPQLLAAGATAAGLAPLVDGATPAQQPQALLQATRGGAAGPEAAGLQALPPWSVGSPLTSPSAAPGGAGRSAAAVPRIGMWQQHVVSGGPHTDAYELPEDRDDDPLGGAGGEHGSDQPLGSEGDAGVAVRGGTRAGSNAQRGFTALRGVAGGGGHGVAASPARLSPASASGRGLAAPDRQRGRRRLLLHSMGVAGGRTPTSQPRTRGVAATTVSAGEAGPSAATAAGHGIGNFVEQGQLPRAEPVAATGPVHSAWHEPLLSPPRRSSRVRAHQQQQRSEGRGQEEQSAGAAAFSHGRTEPSGGTIATGEPAGGDMTPKRRATAVRPKRQPLAHSTRPVEDARLQRPTQQQAAAASEAAGECHPGTGARCGLAEGKSAAAAGAIGIATRASSRGLNSCMPARQAPGAGTGHGRRGRQAVAQSQQQSAEDDQPDASDGTVSSCDGEDEDEEDASEEDTRGAPDCSGRRRSQASRTLRGAAGRLQLSDLRPLLHLPIEDAAGQLGLDCTGLRWRCRQLGIACWPARLLVILDRLEEQLLEEEARCSAPTGSSKALLGDAAAREWLAQVTAARSALLEDPGGFAMPQPLLQLRRRLEKAAYKPRQLVARSQRHSADGDQDDSEGAARARVGEDEDEEDASEEDTRGAPDCSGRRRSQASRTLRGAAGRLQLSDLRPLLHLPIEDAAGQLGLDCTGLRWRCRQLGIACWPARLLVILDRLEEQLLEEEARCSAPTGSSKALLGDAAAREWLAQVTAARSALLEDPGGFAMPQPLLQLRRRLEKAAYKPRQLVARSQRQSADGDQDDSEGAARARVGEDEDEEDASEEDTRGAPDCSGTSRYAAAGTAALHVVSGGPHTDAYELPEDRDDDPLGGAGGEHGSDQPLGSEGDAGVAGRGGTRAGSNAQRGFTALRGVAGGGGHGVAASPARLSPASASGRGLAAPDRQRGRRRLLLHSMGVAGGRTPTSQPRTRGVAATTVSAGEAGPSAATAAGHGIGNFVEQGQLPRAEPVAATGPVHSAWHEPLLSPPRRSSRVRAHQQQQRSEGRGQEEQSAGAAAFSHGRTEPSGGTIATGEPAGGDMTPKRRATAVRPKRQPLAHSTRPVEDARLQRPTQQQAAAASEAAGECHPGTGARCGLAEGKSAAAAGAIGIATRASSRGLNSCMPARQAPGAGTGHGRRGRQAVAQSQQQSAEDDQPDASDGTVSSCDGEDEDEEDASEEDTRGAPDCSGRRRSQASRTLRGAAGRLQLSDLRPLLHLPIEDAAGQLGLDCTGLRWRCRQLGIACWPARLLVILDRLEEQLLEEEARCSAPTGSSKALLGDAAAREWLAQVTAARSALLEDPGGFAMPQPLLQLRRRLEKAAYKPRQLVARSQRHSADGDQDDSEGAARARVGEDEDEEDASEEDTRGAPDCSGRRRSQASRTLRGAAGRLQLSDLRPLLHLPIEDAAGQLGLDCTGLRWRCRQLGIACWPARLLGILDRVEEQLLEEEARCSAPTGSSKALLGDAAAREWLAQVTAARSALLEDPGGFAMPQPLLQLRGRLKKAPYKLSQPQSTEGDQDDSEGGARACDGEDEDEEDVDGQDTRGAPDCSGRRRSQASRTLRGAAGRLQLSDLRPLLHLPIEDAAGQLGLDCTGLRWRCRQLGIACWPARLLVILDRLEEQLLEEEARCSAPTGSSKALARAAAAREWLAQVTAARSALLEDPGGFAMPQPLLQLRGRLGRAAYKRRRRRAAQVDDGRVAGVVRSKE